MGVIKNEIINYDEEEKEKYVYVDGQYIKNEKYIDTLEMKNYSQYNNHLLNIANFFEHGPIVNFMINNNDFRCVEKNETHKNIKKNFDDANCMYIVYVMILCNKYKIFQKFNIV